MPIELKEYILIKDLYHCTPSELAEQDLVTTELHFALMMAERNKEFMREKRAGQKNK